MSEVVLPALIREECGIEVAAVVNPCSDVWMLSCGRLLSKLIIIRTFTMRFLLIQLSRLVCTEKTKLLDNCPFPCTSKHGIDCVDSKLVAIECHVMLWASGNGYFSSGLIPSNNAMLCNA